MDIYYNLSTQYRVDDTGTRTNVKPKIRFKEKPEWTIHFVDSKNAAVNVAGIASWRAALDRDFSSSTEPMCRTLDADIDKTNAATGSISVKLDANTAQFQAAVNGKASAVAAWFELWGFNASGDPEVYVRIDCEAYSVVDPDGGTPPANVESGFVSITDIAAVVNGHPVLSRLSIVNGVLCIDGVPISAASGGSEEPEEPDPEEPQQSEPSMYYGYIDTATADGITSVTQITASMLSASGLTSAAPSELPRTSVGSVPAYAWLVVLLPASSGLYARKYDGLTGPTEFELNNGASNTGANGSEITLNGTSYKVYGEFVLAAGEYSIYVDEEVLQ